MNAHSMRQTMTGRQILAAITAPTLVSIRAFMFAKRPAANMAVYSAKGMTLVLSIAPMTVGQTTFIATTTKLEARSCAPETTVGSGSSCTASLLMTSMVLEPRCTPRSRRALREGPRGRRNRSRDRETRAYRARGGSQRIALVS